MDYIGAYSSHLAMHFYYLWSYVFSASLLSTLIYLCIFWVNKERSLRSFHFSLVNQCFSHLIIKLMSKFRFMHRRFWALLRVWCQAHALCYPLYPYRFPFLWWPCPFHRHLRCHARTDNLPIFSTPCPYSTVIALLVCGNPTKQYRH